jgi:hypothetical protein
VLGANRLNAKPLERCDEISDRFFATTHAKSSCMSGWSANASLATSCFPSIVTTSAFSSGIFSALLGQVHPRAQGTLLAPGA